ncbi:M48 family metallopeptidase [Chitiniphilus purpureus]|uniref:M48 family metallopeptidase n=1 Tax=Chitiniphilus purpureus TaxID=2981137 RepID=A0ABY6DLC7_9NEIS|nr:SprT family zinc-dependent metalloprotease [Chitiniphilus sp. CD1]UXY15164.1 M48 family metallopeptidase [Chitiniphilus sp. CD1]
MAAGRHCVQLAGRALEYSVVRSQRRSIGLKIDAQGLTVQLPLRVPLTEAEAVIQRKLAWIMRHLDALPPPRGALDDGSQVAWLGQPRLLRLGAARTRLTETELWLQGDTARADEALVRLLQRSARSHFAERTALWAGRMGLAPRRVLLTSARGRWGSCSANGDIRLNWRLMQAPPEVIDYVVIHELAHLAELNHSARFWALVEQACPDWRQLRAWLRLNGGELLRL